MNNPYATRQNVFIKDPSGRLAPSGMREFNFPYTPTVTVSQVLTIVHMI